MRLKQNPSTLGLLVSTVWLSGLVGVSRLTEQPVSLLIPYALPVFYLSCRHSLAPSLVAAGFATLAALLGGAIPSRPDYADYLLAEGFLLYAKLSGIAFGTRLA